MDLRLGGLGGQGIEVGLHPGSGDGDGDADGQTHQYAQEFQTHTVVAGGAGWFRAGDVSGECLW